MNKPSHFSTSRTGQGMVYAAWILLLGLLTYFFNNYLEQQQNPNREIPSASSGTEIRLQRNRYGHYVTSGRINGQPVTFLLDTGATTISIPQTVARKLNLRAGAPIPVRTANGTVTVYSTRLNSVSIGPIELPDLRADINPHMDGTEILLGMNFLRHLELLQQGDQLILRIPGQIP